MRYWVFWPSHPKVFNLEKYRDMHSTFVQLVEIYRPAVGTTAAK